MRHWLPTGWTLLIRQDDGAELVTGSELERGLALLITQRRSLAEEGRFAHQAALRRQVAMVVVTGAGQVRRDLDSEVTRGSASKSMR